MPILKWMRENKPPGLAAVVVPYIIVVLTGITLFTGYTAIQTQDFAKQLRQGLVRGCDVNGNPLREVVQSILSEDIKQSKALPASYFPGIPPKKFHELVRAQRERNEARSRRIAPINCAAAFPADQ